MPSKPPENSVPPVEPTPVVPPAPPAPPAPPIVAPYDPYAQAGPGPAVAPAYAPAAYAPAGYYAPQPPKSLAIASLITGIGGTFFSFFYGLGFLPSLAAVITGHLARKRQPYARGMWLAGLITGYIGLGISLLWIIGIVIFVIFVIINPAYFDTGQLGDY